jgi:hypothetical protein
MQRAVPHSDYTIGGDERERASSRGRVAGSARLGYAALTAKKIREINESQARAVLARLTTGHSSQRIASVQTIKQLGRSFTIVKRAIEATPAPRDAQQRRHMEAMGSSKS